MSRREHRRRGRNSLGSVVDDSARIASRLGLVGAMVTGAIGFIVFYALLPVALMAWSDANKAKLVGPAAAVFAHLLDQLMWQRFIGPSQWAGLAILLACWAIAAWKAFSDDALTNDELAVAGWAAKLLARLLR